MNFLQPRSLTVPTTPPPPPPSLGESYIAAILAFPVFDHHLWPFANYCATQSSGLPPPPSRRGQINLSHLARVGGEYVNWCRKHRSDVEGERANQRVGMLAHFYRKSESKF